MTCATISSFCWQIAHNNIFLLFNLAGAKQLYYILSYLKVYVNFALWCLNAIPSGYVTLRIPMLSSITFIKPTFFFLVFLYGNVV